MHIWGAKMAPGAKILWGKLSKKSGCHLEGNCQTKAQKCQKSAWKCIKIV